jgi:tetratricopeptide (TPR) repeat protein
MAFMMDDLERARGVLDEALALAQRRGDQMGIAVGNHTVGQVARLQGRFEDAVRHYREAIRFGHGLGDDASLTEPLQGLAAVEIASGDVARGVRLLGACAAIRERLGGGPPPEWLRLGDPLADAREALGDAAYQRAWDAGLALTVDQAVAEALEEPAG